MTEQHEPTAATVPQHQPAHPNTQAAPLGEEDGPPPPTPLSRAVQQTFDRLWQSTANPWVTATIAVLLALLAALAFVLPQLPSQLHNETNAAARWLVTTASSLGPTGPLLRSLGLLNVIHSPLFQTITVLLLFLLLQQAAQQALNALALQRLPETLDQEHTTNGEPLPVALADTIVRWRQSHPDAPLTVARQLQFWLEARFRRVHRRTVRVEPAPLAESELEPLPAGPGLEERLLALRGLRGSLLRPLLPLAMIAAVIFIWLNTAYGWEFTPDALAPGERTSDAVHSVAFEYALQEPIPGTLSPRLRVTVGDQTAVLPLEPDMQLALAGVEVEVQPGTPALLVRRLDGTASLARPGQATPVSTIGLDFPNPGSEDTLLLPQQALGLRIVRSDPGTPGTAVDDEFRVEVFRGDSETAVERFTVRGNQIETIAGGGQRIALAFVPLPSLAIQVRFIPGQWLLWLSAGLLLASLPGYRQRPGFVLVQIGAWPWQRSVLVAQSNLAEELDSIQRWQREQLASPPANAGAGTEAPHR